MAPEAIEVAPLDMTTTSGVVVLSGEVALSNGESSESELK